MSRKSIKRIIRYEFVGRTNSLCASLNLPLTDGIDTGDVVHPFDAILVALMDGVNTHKAGSPVGTGRLAHANRVAHGMGFGETPAQSLIAQQF